MGFVRFRVLVLGYLKAQGLPGELREAIWESAFCDEAEDTCWQH